MYSFNLEFRIKSVRSDVVDFLASSKVNTSIDQRSVNCEVYLQPGIYEVFPKVTASHCVWQKTVEEVVKRQAQENPAKLRKVGLQYDLAHAKVGVLDEDEKQRNKRLAQRRKKKQKAEKGNTEAGGPQESANQLMQWVVSRVQEELRKCVTFSSGSAENHTEDPREDKPVVTEKGDDKAREESKGKSEDVTDGAAIPSQPAACPPGCWPEKSALDNEERAITEQSKAEQNAVVGETESRVDIPAQEPELGSVPEVQDSCGSAPGQLTPSTDSDSSSDSDSDSDSEWGSDSDSEPDVDESTMPSQRWNPVCVMCLRVYAQDKEVSVRLAEGKPGAEVAAGKDTDQQATTKS
jgi:hypothetical protein